MNPSNATLVDLVDEPRETLDVEIKEWLDLSGNEHRALLAKEIIALANHGGGYLVVGFRELTDGTFVKDDRRPANLDAWSQDSIQSIVSKYIDPTIQCRVHHIPASDCTGCYPIISVPGGHRVPIRAKAGSPDGKKLVPHKTYIRRAGPASEEPLTAEEWDRLLGRIVQNRQDELLEVFRTLMSGVLPSAGPTTTTTLERLKAFVEQSINGWQRRIEPLPKDVSARLPNGYYDVGFAIDGHFDEVSITRLRETIAREVRNHSGWPPFMTIPRTPYTPSPVDGAVEAWIGPGTDGTYDRPAHHDFWRVSPEGFFFTRRGYPEDGGIKGVYPGTTLDITSPTRRLGEAILAATYVAKALNATQSNLIIYTRWERLNGRQLVSHGNTNQWVLPHYICRQDEYETTTTVALDSLPTTLPEVVFEILRPLYELFDFFELSKQLVEQELSDLQKNR